MGAIQVLDEKPPWAARCAREPSHYGVTVAAVARAARLALGCRARRRYRTLGMQPRRCLAASGAGLSKRDSQLEQQPAGIWIEPDVSASDLQASWGRYKTS